MPKNHPGPKTSDELREQIEAQQDRPAAEGGERTAEGEEVRTPNRGEFFGNLGKVAEPRGE
jgi:hypothetical protein